jgi:hypothetical protein
MARGEGNAADAAARVLGLPERGVPRTGALRTAHFGVPASAAIVERMFAGARAALPFNMGASDRETIHKRFFLHVNRRAAVAVIRAHPELRPMVRITTGVASARLSGRWSLRRWLLAMRQQVSVHDS